MMLWLVWFAYYSQTATVGLVEADSAVEAQEQFWHTHGDGDWPFGGVHALPAAPGQLIQIRAEH